MKEFKNRKGYFLQKYESSEDVEYPIFRKDDKNQVPIELPKMIEE